MLAAVSIDAALVTATAAVVGVLVTVAFNLVHRRDALGQTKRQGLYDASKRLPSTEPGERAVGIDLVSGYLADATTGHTAAGLLTAHVHFETERLLRSLAIDGIAADPAHATTCVDVLLRYNRELWTDLIRGFRWSLLHDDAPDQGVRVQTLLAQLRRNGEALARVFAAMQARDQPLRGFDFADCYYPQLNLRGSPTRSEGLHLIECRFDRALLHYANAHRVTFEHCRFDDTVLVGAYLEGATFVLAHDTDLAAANLVAPDGLRTPEQLVGPLAVAVRRWEGCTSFLVEEEYDWRGYWESQTPAGDRFAARWKSQVQADITGEIIKDGDGFRRIHSDNDGTYRIDGRVTLDAKRGVELVGGTRVLQERVPEVWHAIWWPRLDPTRVAGPGSTARTEVVTRP